MKNSKNNFIYLIFLILFVCFKSFGQSSNNGYPNISDERFVLLVADFEYNTNFYYLVDSKKDNSVLVWLKISLPNINVPDTKGSEITKSGGYELILYKIGCTSKIAEEIKRIKLNEYGTVESVLFKYPSGGNKNTIGSNTFLDLLRVNACNLN